MEPTAAKPPKLWTSQVTLAICLMLLVGFKVMNQTVETNQPNAATAEPTAVQTPVQAPPEDLGQHKELASAIYKTPLRQAIYARANYLFSKAQEQPNAQAWLSDRHEALLDEVKGIHSQYGVLTGEAEQFELATNLLSEIAATQLAWQWVTTGLEQQPASVNLNPLIGSMEAIANEQ